MTTTATTARERMLLAKEASRSIGLLTDAEKRDVLRSIADAIERRRPRSSRRTARTSSGGVPPDSPTRCRTG
jgi:hypothetical protein